MEFLEACRKFIALDSTPANGNFDVANYAALLCQRAGLQVELQHESLNGVDQANVIARPMKVLPDQEFLMQTHLDTVDPGSYGLWSKTGSNPFNASIYQDTIYGLGAADVKLDFLCKLKAVEAFKNATWRLPFVLVGTFGEELGMAGAIKLIRKKKISARAALVGEPTQLRLIHSGKGFAKVEIEIPFSAEEMAYKERHNMSDGSSTQSKIFVGRAAHSSAPQLGESAILKMLEYLTKLPEGIAVMELEGGTNFNTIPGHAVLEFDMVGGMKDTISQRLARVMDAIARVERDFKSFPDRTFDPPCPTLNIGMIRTLGDHVKMSGCCRVPPSVTNDVYEEWMAILKAACEEVGGAFHVVDYKQPFKTPNDSSLVRICQEQLGKIGLSPEVGTQSVANEANVFSRFGVECVVIGPGQGVGNSHAPNEHVKIKQLLDAVEFYKGVIERVCL